jgi:hypothetical protein
MVFGGWTSDSRQTVKPVLEGHALLEGPVLDGVHLEPFLR